MQFKMTKVLNMITFEAIPSFTPLKWMLNCSLPPVINNNKSAAEKKKILIFFGLN